MYVLVFKRVQQDAEIQYYGKEVEGNGHGHLLKSSDYTVDNYWSQCNVSKT
jgi:hypothetical protein